eukprot:SAG31_NODE_10899_length_1086_cov_0.940223_1_plen_129_part_10
MAVIEPSGRPVGTFVRGGRTISAGTGAPPARAAQPVAQSWPSAQPQRVSAAASTDSDSGDDDSDSDDDVAGYVEGGIVFGSGEVPRPGTGGGDSGNQPARVGAEADSPAERIREQQRQLAGAEQRAEAA